MTATEETYIIYADILFLINLILDFMCLYVTGTLLPSRGGILPKLAAAACGGGYSVLAAALTDIGWYYLFPLHIAAATLMCVIAFGVRSAGYVLTRTAVFVLTGAVSGGILSAFFALTGRFFTLRGGFYANVSPVFLVVVAVVAVGAAYIYALICRKRSCFRTVGAKIVKSGKSYDATLLVDSGCFVTDPISGRGVVIVTAEVFRGSVPEAPRFIPLKTAGGTAVLFGFTPDSLTVTTAGKVINVTATVAVDTASRGFSGCDGLISPSLLR